MSYHSRALHLSFHNSGDCVYMYARPGWVPSRLLNYSPTVLHLLIRRSMPFALPKALRCSPSKTTRGEKQSLDQTSDCFSEKAPLLSSLGVRGPTRGQTLQSTRSRLGRLKSKLGGGVGQSQKDLYSYHGGGYEEDQKSSAVSGTSDPPTRERASQKFPTLDPQYKIRLLGPTRSQSTDRDRCWSLAFGRLAGNEGFALWQYNFGQRRSTQSAAGTATQNGTSDSAILFVTIDFEQSLNARSLFPDASYSASYSSRNPPANEWAHYGPLPSGIELSVNPHFYPSTRSFKHAIESWRGVIGSNLQYPRLHPDSPMPRPHWDVLGEFVGLDEGEERHIREAMEMELKEHVSQVVSSHE